MIRHCLALALKNDPELIREYEDHHKSIWPEVVASIKASGIRNMEIYRLGTRLFMILEVDDDFSFKEKAKADHANEVVQEWENLMWQYQEALPEAAKGEKWLLMTRIFDLHNFLQQ